MKLKCQVISGYRFKRTKELMNITERNTETQIYKKQINKILGKPWLKADWVIRSEKAWL